MDVDAHESCLVAASSPFRQSASLLPNGWDDICDKLSNLFSASACQHPSAILQKLHHTVDGWNPAPVEVGSLSHYFYGFIHPRWCRISSINSNTIPCLGKTWEETIEDRIMRCQEGPVPMMHMQPSTWVRSHIDIAMIRSFCIRVYTNTCQNDQGKAAKHIKNFTAILGWWIIYHMPLHFLSTVTFHLESYKGSRITWFTWGFAEFAYKTPRPWNFM